MCAYKESPYLDDCIKSCLNQTSVKEGISTVIVYTSIENIFIKTICEAHQVSLFVGAGGSIGKDWNNALSFVETRYATIAHQDDIYLPEYGTSILSQFDRSNLTNIVFTDYTENDALGNLRPRSINLKIKTVALNVMSWLPFKAYQRRIYAFGNFICCPAVSYDLKRLQHFKFNEELKMTLDWDAWERIMKLPGNVRFIKTRLMLHRIHSESETTATTNDHTREREEYLIYQRYWGSAIAKFLMKLYIYNQRSNF